MSISAFNPAAVPAASNAPAINGLPAVPAANNSTAGYSADSYASNAAPAANMAPAVMPPSYNQAPAPAPVQVKSAGSGGLFGLLGAAAAGGFAALKYVVPKFLPSLLKNPSTLKSFGIFGAGAAAAVLGFSFLKNKLFGGASQAQAQAQQIPPEALAQIQQLLQAGVPPQALMQQGVPPEVLRMAGAQI